MSTKILVVDDEPQIQKLLRVALESSGYECVVAACGKEAIEKTALEQPRAVILDLGLPDIGGLEVIREIRSWSALPILILSVKQTVEEKVAALDLGADDYLTKPFHTSELLARLRAILRHAPTDAENNVLEFEKIKIDLSKRSVTRGEESIHLSATEYALLVLLAKNIGKVVTHRQILETVWGGAPEADVSKLRVYINFLRKKIESEPSMPTLIQSEPGIGYRLQWK